MEGEEPPKKSGFKGKWAKRNFPAMSRVELTNVSQTPKYVVLQPSQVVKFVNQSLGGLGLEYLMSKYFTINWFYSENSNV
jgi:hypothetical protein